MKSMKLTVALVLGLLGAVPALGQDALGSFRFDLAGQSYRVPSIRSRVPKGTPPQELISLRGLGAAIGAEVKPAGQTGSFRMEVGGAAGAVVRFSAESPAAVRVNDQIVPLSKEARRIGNDLYVPVDFLKRVVIPLLEGSAVEGETVAATRELPAKDTRSSSAPILHPEAGAPGRSDSPETVSSVSARASSSAHHPTAARVSAPSVVRVSASSSPDSREAVPLRAGRGAPAPSNLVLVLDPGHGGSETGAEGKTGVFEKDITLDIARRLKAILATQSDVTVLLTREIDEAIGLDERTALANQNHADLFVSIHVNSASRRDARGAETYFLASKSKDEEVRTLAAMENNAAGVDREQMGEVPEGLELVLWDLAQSQYLEGSSRLGESIQNEMNDALGIKDRGVKRAPFRVLMGATMPAVLVEVGFISNPDEEESLKSEDHREKIAQALSRAIIAYLPEARKRFTTPAQRVR